MIDRKKKIILIQLTIFLIASMLVYNTYKDKNELIEKKVQVQNETELETNSFSDIEYSGFDLSGNRYILKAGVADFKTSAPEDINMKNMTATFYLKDDTTLKVISREGSYNNISLNMEFREDVVATYLSNNLFSDQLNYFNSSGKLVASGNVRGESVEKGEFFADNVEYNITSKFLDFSMFGEAQVKLKIKN